MSAIGEMDGLYHTWPNVAGRASGPRAIAGIALASCVLALSIQLPRHVNHDVAYLTWVADQVWRGAIFGIDIRELNPPLAFIIYWPAACLAQWTGFDLAIKLWITAVVAVSILLLGRTSQPGLRLPIAITLGLFAALAYPREFGQREQIALLLFAPYSAGYARLARWNVLSGVLAGLAVCIKPHFLIAPLLLLALRRKIGLAEWALALTGMSYAIVLLLFFQPWLETMLPNAAISYSGIPMRNTGPEQLAMLLAMLAVSCEIGRRGCDASAWGLGLAALGFALAALLQGKLFPYHFLAAWGFLLLQLAVLVATATEKFRLMAIGVLAIASLQQFHKTLPWWRDIERRETVIPELVQAINQARDHTVISDYPFPAFPTAIYAHKPYRGAGACNVMLAAVGRLETQQDRSIDPRVRQLALDFAISELERQPELVIVNDDWQSFSSLRSREFDGLAWLDRQPRFQIFWRHYREIGRTGNFRLFKRQPGSPLAR